MKYQVPREKKWEGIRDANDYKTIILFIILDVQGGAGELCTPGSLGVCKKSDSSHWYGNHCLYAQIFLYMFFAQ